VVTIKKVYFLPIALLLAFIFFSVLHTSNLFIQSHHSNKAVLLIDDWNMKSQTDDEEKHLFHFDLIEVLTLISLIVVTIHRIFSDNHTRNSIFLIPVFHQSNYVILSPKFIS
jgi:hypothetical protein